MRSSVQNIVGACIHIPINTIGLKIGYYKYLVLKGVCLNQYQQIVSYGTNHE